MPVPLPATHNDQLAVGGWGACKSPILINLRYEHLYEHPSIRALSPSRTIHRCHVPLSTGAMRDFWWHTYLVTSSHSNFE